MHPKIYMSMEEEKPWLIFFLRSQWIVEVEHQLLSYLHHHESQIPGREDLTGRKRARTEENMLKRRMTSYLSTVEKGLMASDKLQKCLF